MGRLRDLVFQNLKDTDRLDLWPEARKELLSLESQEIDGLYLAAHERGAKCENTANSLVAYILGICDEKPSGDMVVREMGSLADIDSDFDKFRREEIIDHVRDMYGHDNVHNIGTFGLYKLKSSIREIMRFKQVPNDDVNAMTKGITEGDDSSLETAVTENEQLAERLAKHSDERKLMQDVQGAYSNISMHASGIIISSVPIHDFVPMSCTKNGPVTAVDMRRVESYGLVKFDFLGLDNVTIMSHTLDLIEQRHGKRILLEKIPMDDPECLKRFNAADNDTIFQFETGGFSKALQELEINSFEDLVAIVALHRPGSKKFISPFFYDRGRKKVADKDGPADPHESPIGTYKENKADPDQIVEIHPAITPILAETYGIPVYQEQAMKIVQVLSGASLIEADKLRKAIGKKEGKLFEKCRLNFYEGCKKNNVDEDVANRVWRMLEEFDKYSFNKSHAAAYAMIGYWNMWLRTYFPKEWYASVFSVKLAGEAEDATSRKSKGKGLTDRRERWNGEGYYEGFYTRLEWYRYKATRRGCEVEDPQVNHSRSKRAVIDDDGIIYLPFCTIKGVGRGSESVAANGPYDSFDDFVKRSGASRSLIRILIDKKACEDFGMMDDDMLRRLEEMLLIAREDKAANSARKRKTDAETDPTVNSILLGDFQGVPSIGMKKKMITAVSNAEIQWKERK